MILIPLVFIHSIGLKTWSKFSYFENHFGGEFCQKEIIWSPSKNGSL